jgi:hypothetical protein
VAGCKRRVFTEASDGREPERERGARRAARETSKRNWKLAGGASIQMMKKDGPDRRCGEGGAPELMRSFKLGLLVDAPAWDGWEDDSVFSDASSRFDGDAERKLRTMVISRPERELGIGPDHADGAESGVLNVCSCISGDLPPAEVAESLIRSGVPGWEGVQIESSGMDEIPCGLLALNETVVFCHV